MLAVGLDRTEVLARKARIREQATQSRQRMLPCRSAHALQSVITREQPHVPVLTHRAARSLNEWFESGVRTAGILDDHGFMCAVRAGYRLRLILRNAYLAGQTVLVRECSS